MIRTHWLIVGIALAGVACSSPPPARAPLEMVKLEPSPGGGSGTTPPLALHSKIPVTSSANDLDNSGPKVSEPPQEKAKGAPRLADPERHVGLTKHDSLPVGGNLQGTRELR